MNATQEGVNIGIDFAIDMLKDDGIAMTFLTLKQYRDSMINALRDAKNYE